MIEDDADDLRDQARKLAPSWDDKRAARVKAGLMDRLSAPATPASTRGARRPRRVWLAVAGIAAAASVAYAAVEGTFSSPDHAAPQGAPAPLASVAQRGAVHARSGADFALIGPQPDEVVRLFDGTLSVEVEPLQAGERFRVVTGDAEVEVHGTVFDIQVADDRLVLVRVIEGTVEVRPLAHDSVTLETGERWVAPESDSDSEAAPSSTPAAPSASAAASAPAASASAGASATASASAQPSASARRGPTPDEVAFREAWAAIQKGDYDRAAKRLEGVRGDAAVAEDAEFWRAMSLVRSGKREAGARELQAFLTKYPKSRRRAEVEAALAALRTPPP